MPLACCTQPSNRRVFQRSSILTAGAVVVAVAVHRLNVPDITTEAITPIRHGPSSSDRSKERAPKCVWHLFRQHLVSQLFLIALLILTVSAIPKQHRLNEVYHFLNGRKISLLRVFLMTRMGSSVLRASCFPGGAIRSGIDATRI